MKKIRVKVKFEILPKEVEREIIFDADTFVGGLSKKVHEECLAWAEKSYECSVDWIEIDVEEECDA